MRILLFILILIPSLTFSQIVVNNKERPNLLEETFHLNKTLKLRKEFSYKEYYDNGQVRLITKIKDLKPDGILLSYWKNGNVKEKDLYSNGYLLEGKTWDINGNEEEYSEFEISIHLIKD